MDRNSIERFEQEIAELASFSINKLASLESRFIILCHRAKAAGIDCDDLCDGYVAVEPKTTEPLRIMN